MALTPQQRLSASSDAALVEAIGARRDQSAFAELFARYAPRLKAYFLKAGKGDAHAEDIVQDVFLSLWRHAESYRPELASVPTWIFRIARNRFVDGVRKERFVDIDGFDPDSLGAAEHVTADDALESGELSEAVQRALSELPDIQAEVVRGSYYRHESATQMAARMGIPVGTVKSRMRAAMTHLQRRLFDRGGP